jgi:hypothetical protein
MFGAFALNHLVRRLAQAGCQAFAPALDFAESHKSTGLCNREHIDIAIDHEVSLEKVRARGRIPFS